MKSYWIKQQFINGPNYGAQFLTDVSFATYRAFVAWINVINSTPDLDTKIVLYEGE